MSRTPLVDPAAAFRAALADAGLHTAEPIHADGALHRFRVEGDRPGDRNGWYVLHPNPPVAGAFGCWKRGCSGTWSATEGEPWTTADLALLRRRAEQTRAARKKERAAMHEEARQRAAVLWQAATPARGNHPYLRCKRVSAGSARQTGPCLVLPVVDLHGRLWSLQFIDGDGRKTLLSGGRKQGHYIPVAEPSGAARVLICEGWATGRTLAAMEPAARVLAAVDAGNLEPVAVAARQRWPDVEIVVCCDADPVGRSKGRAAALAAGALLAVPEFPSGVPGSDFNDLVNADLRRAA